MSIEEMISQILNDKARFKLELFESGKCPYNAQRFLSDFYEFEGEDIREAKEAAAAEKHLKLMKGIQSRSRKDQR